MFFLLIPENRLRLFMLGKKNKKNVNVSSAVFAQSVMKISFGYDIISDDS